MPDVREGWHWDNEEALRAALDGFKASIWTALPVRVVEDSDGKTVKLQVTIKGQKKSEKGKLEHVEYPQLEDVPIHFAGGGGDEGKGSKATVSTHPIKKDDEGLVVFMSRPLDTWFEQGGTQNAQDLRAHSLSDGIYIPGIRSKPRELKNISTDAHQIRSVDGKNTLQQHPEQGTKSKAVDPSDKSEDPFKDAKKYHESSTHHSGIAHKAVSDKTTHQVTVTHKDGAKMSGDNDKTVVQAHPDKAFLSAENGKNKVEALSDKVNVQSDKKIALNAPITEVSGLLSIANATTGGSEGGGGGGAGGGGSGGGGAGGGTGGATQVLVGNSIYRFKVTYPGIPGPGVLMAGEVFDSAVTLFTSLNQARFRCVTPPVDDYVISLRKNGAEVGTITFAAGETAATFVGGLISFSADDTLTLFSPETLDVISGIFGVIPGLRAPYA